MKDRIIEIPLVITNNIGETLSAPVMAGPSFNGNDAFFTGRFVWDFSAESFIDLGSFTVSYKLAESDDFTVLTVPFQGNNLPKLVAALNNLSLGVFTEQPQNMVSIYSNYIFGEIDLISADTSFQITSQPASAVVTDTNQQVSGSVSPTFLPTSDNIANPERGFYHHEQSMADGVPGVYVPLDKTSLETARTGPDAITLVLRLFYLENHVDGSPLSVGLLDSISADFATIREAGVKAIVRFAYSDNENELAPINERDINPTLAQIQAHILQLKPILFANVDVILCIQAGFIGVWGEWYKTDHFGWEGAISVSEQADRKTLVEFMMLHFPSNRFILMRTPKIKQLITETETPVNSATAFQNTLVARLGHHNDAIMASPTDYGTYPDREVDIAFVAAETAFVPSIGETANVNTDTEWGAACSHAEPELRQLHYTAVNLDYIEGVVDDTGVWETQGCRENIRRELGPRLELTQATLPETVKNRFPINMDIENSGYANLFNPRPVNVIFRDTVTSDEYVVGIETDIRQWSSLESIVQDLDTSGVPPGQYDLFVSLPDTYLSTDPAYAFRLANDAIWDPFSGYNSLDVTVTVAERDILQHNFTVETNTPAATYQWQEDFGDGFQDITDGENGDGVTFAGATTSILEISGFSIAYNGRNYRVVLNAATDNVVSDPAELVVT